jgi:protease I
MAKKILIITGDAGESYETLYAKHRLMEAGYVPVIASTRTGPLNLVMHDFEPGWDTYVERPGYKLSADLTFKEAKVGDYVAVLLIGGRAPEYLRLDAKVLQAVRHFATAKKPIAAICHAAQILAAAGIVQGRKISCYPAVSPDVTIAGGTFIEVAMDQAVADGNLITAPAWPAHPAWMSKFLVVLGTKIEL